MLVERPAYLARLRLQLPPDEQKEAIARDGRGVRVFCRDW